MLQLGFALHVRNTLTAAAAEGASYGAAAGRDPDDAVARTRELVGSALAPSYATDVVASEESADGLPTVVVEVRSALPVLGSVGSFGRAPGSCTRARRGPMTDTTGDESGSAIVEFVLLAVVLIVPFVYVLLCVFEVERAAFRGHGSVP